MRSRLALAKVFAVAVIAPATLPCGAPFGNGVNVDPKQDIIVVHKGGVETHVFQPRFCGNAREFGLVLPGIGEKAWSKPLAMSIPCAMQWLYVMMRDDAR